MLVKPEIAFSLKCASCGKAKLHTFDAFRLMNGHHMCICDCRKSCMEVFVEGNFVVSRFLCPYCGQIHSYRVDIHDLLHGSVNELICGKTEMVCAYAGETNAVKQKIDRYHTAMDHLLRELCEDIEADTQHTLPPVPATHVAQVLCKTKEMLCSHRITCPCGSKKYELAFLNGYVQIKCGLCGASVRLAARTEEELDQIKQSGNILLSELRI